MRKKEKSRQVLAHKRGRKWQIDGHHVEYDVLQPSRMMDVLNSAQWTKIFSERGFQFVPTFLFEGYLPQKTEGASAQFLILCGIYNLDG